MRTRVKICGITRAEDGLAAARLGADAIGLVFYPPSPRAVDLSRAAEIAQDMPAFVTRVGLFVDASVREVNTVLQTVPLDVLQFHGNESPEQCEQFEFPYIKAIRMKPGIDIRQLADSFTKASGILLDAYQKGVPGGTGTTFDWENIPAGLYKPVILAGGLNAENVASAIQTVRPYAVDVSGGVEAAKGIKDLNKMTSFIETVNAI